MSTPYLESWREIALCREVDPEIMFPEKGGSAKPGKRICGLCSVRAACLVDALTFPQSEDRFGILGGTTPRERVRLRNEAARPLAPVVHLPVSSVPEHRRAA